MEQLGELLEQERKYFLDYEAATYAIAANAVEEMEAQMHIRTHCQEQIDRLLQEIETVCGDDAEGQRLLSITRNQCSRGELSGEPQSLFDKGMAIRAIILRIREMEPQALERLTEERDILLEKIKSVNQGNEAAASRYYRSTTPKESDRKGYTFKKV